MNQSICPNCETSNPSDEVVCFKCGAVLEEQRLSGGNVRIFRDDRSSKLGWVHRIFAAVWFAGTAVVPIFLLTSTTGLANNPDRFGSFFLLGVPVLLAAAAGFSIGARILDRSKTRNALVAAWKGVLTAGVSFVAYITFLSLVGGFTIYGATRSAMELVMAIAGLFALYLLYGSMIIGWVVLIAGAIGGALLYAFSTSPERIVVDSGRIGGPNNKTVAIVAGLLVFAACIVPIGINLTVTRPQQVESLRKFEEMQRLQSLSDSDVEFLRPKLAAGADPNFPEVPSGPLLAAAATNGQKEIVRLLLEYGADPNRTSEHGPLPIVSAARYPDTQMLQDLIRAGADVNCPDRGGTTALMNAAMTSNPKAVEILLTSGAAINASDSTGKTALGWAQERKEKYFTSRTDASAEIEAESKALDKTIALLKKHGGKQ